MKLIHKIFWIILIISLSILTFGTYFIYFNFNHILRGQVTEAQALTGTSVAHQVDQQINRYQADINLVADDTVIHEIITSKATPSANQKMELNELLQKTGPWTSFLVITPNKKIIYTQGTPYSLAQLFSDPNATHAVQAALQGENFTSDLYNSQIFNTPTMVLSAPIFDANHTTVHGATVSFVNWHTITGILNQTPNYHAYLINAAGFVISTNNPDPKIKILITNARDNTSVDQLINLNNTTTIVPFFTGNYESIVSYAPLMSTSSLPSRGWSIILENSSSVAFQEVNKTVTSIVIFIVIVTTSGSALFLYLIQSLVITPISNFTKVSRAIASGHLDNRMTKLSNDEIGEMAKDFNTMTDKLVHTQKLDEALLASMADGVFATDIKGNIFLINKSGQEILGVTEAEIMGKHFTEIGPIVDENGAVLDTSVRPTQKVLDTQQALTSYIVRFKRHDNKVVPISVNVAPIILEGKLLGAIDVFRDVTHELELDKSKTEFVSIASHQLRMPPTAIAWSVELLKEKKQELNKEQSLLLEQIEHANQQMILLVDALLNTSRMELGTFSVNPTPIYVRDVVDEVLHDLQAQIKKKKLHITRDWPTDRQEVNLDPNLTGILIRNILTNSIKYTPPEGSIIVRLKVETTSLLLSIADTGYGIPKNQQSRIFTKLFRADNVLHLATEGTGLGLYLAKSIVDYMAGEIWFDSEENKGTIIYIRIPKAGMKQKEGRTKIDFHE